MRRLGFSKPTRDPAEQERLFTSFRAAGYDGLQLKLNQYRADLDQPERFRSRWGAYPGVAAGLIVGARLDEPGVAQLRRVIRFAAAVGADPVVVVLDEPRREAPERPIEQCARILSALGREAKQAGTKLSLHHHYQQLVMTRDEIARFFSAVEDRAVGLTVDTAHLVKSGVTDVSGIIREFQQVVDNVHAKDYADGEWRVLGHGAIDFAPIFAALREMDFAGWVCADEESGSDLDRALRECHRHLRDELEASRGRRPLPRGTTSPPMQSRPFHLRSYSPSRAMVPEREERTTELSSAELLEEGGEIAVNLCQRLPLGGR